MSQEQRVRCCGPRRGVQHRQAAAAARSPARGRRGRARGSILGWAPGAGNRPGTGSCPRKKLESPRGAVAFIGRQGRADAPEAAPNARQRHRPEREPDPSVKRRVTGEVRKPGHNSGWRDRVPWADGGFRDPGRWLPRTSREGQNPGGGRRGSAAGPRGGTVVRSAESLHKPRGHHRAIFRPGLTPHATPHARRDWVVWSTVITPDRLDQAQGPPPRAVTDHVIIDIHPRADTCGKRGDSTPRGTGCRKDWGPQGAGHP